MKDNVGKIKKTNPDSERRFDRITEIFKNYLPKAKITLFDESSRHKGHPGSPGGSETHFIAWIREESLEGLSRVEAHRRVMNLLKPEFDRGLHALKLHINDKA